MIMIKVGLEAKTMDACLRTLVLVGYHMQVQFAKFLAEWTPPHPVSEDTRRILEVKYSYRKNFQTAKLYLKLTTSDRPYVHR